jgi:choline kinase
MKAIIVAAGMGRRLAPYTDDRPKCLVPVKGSPLLLRQMEAYRQAGVTEFILVRGYLGDRLAEALSAEPDVRFIDNEDFRRNNILLSMMCAEAAMDGGFLFSYSDIVFRPELVRAVRDDPADLSLCVDPHFSEVYEGRTEHPIEEAELAEVQGGRVLRVGKKAVPVERAHGEFIGLMKVSAQGADAMRDLYWRRRRQLGLDAPYGRAPRMEVAYVTDLLNDLIEQGVYPRSVDIPRSGSWREIDTVQDLHRAEGVVDW